LLETVNGRFGSTTTLTSSLNPSAVGQSVTFAAEVSGSSPSQIPTGIVTFLDGSTTLGSDTLSTDIAGLEEATFTTSSLAIGSHLITVEYGGDSMSNNSVSPVLAQAVTFP